MSSASRTRLGVALAAALALGACSKPAQPPAQPPDAAAGAPLPKISHLYPASAYPGSVPAAPEPAQLVAFQNDAAHIASGKQYYKAFHCDGCHFNGGGGIGPAFLDPTWRYGGSLEEIHNSIAEGRPNGMPVWGFTIPDPQIWEIAAYVHSLSPPNPQAATGAPTSAAAPPNLTSSPKDGQQSG